MRLSSTTTQLIFFTIATFSLQKTASLPTKISVSSCNKTFSCGQLRNISYPFTGGDRPRYCGPPEFRLNCRLNSIAFLNMDSLSYRVLQINQSNRTLRLARSDLYNTNCTNQFFSTTLDPGIFTLPTSIQNLSIFYSCNASFLFSRLPQKPDNLFYCNVNDGFRDSFFLVGPIPYDSAFSAIKCRYSVVLPILGSSVQKLRVNKSFFMESINIGFDVNYHIPFDDNCKRCSSSGGVCGLEFDGKFICECGDRPCSGSNFSEVGLGKWVTIAAVVVIATFLICWEVMVLKVNKKRKLAQLQDSRTANPSSRNILSTSHVNTLNLHISSSRLDPADKGSTYFGAQKFSYSELEEATHDFDSSKELGDGGFASVYQGVLRDGRVVAVKRLYETNVKRVEQFTNELEILTQLRHQNLVALYGFSSNNARSLLLVYEFIPNGTLADHLYRTNSKSCSFLAWSVRLNIAIEIADALAYLHASDIIHRDVKTHNILLDNNFRVKVADFGLSRLFPGDATHISTNPQGTPGYLDPDYNQSFQLTDKSDVYSFGVVLIQLISSLPAVDICREKSEIKLTNMAIHKIQNNALNELVDPNLGFEEDYDVRKMICLVADLAFNCLLEEKDMRPTMKEVLKSLKRIQNEDDQSELATKIDVRQADLQPSEYVTATISPISVAKMWVNNSRITSSCQ